MSDLKSQSVAEETAHLSQLLRVTNIFTAPSKTFDDINRGNGSWWLPLVLIAIASYILFAAITVEIGWQTVADNTIHFDPKAEERMAQASPEQRQVINRVTRYSIEGDCAASPVLTLATVSLLSLGLWGTVNVAFGGMAKYRNILAVWFYASLPSVIKLMLATLVVFLVGTPESFNFKNPAPTNIGAFLDPLEANRALYALASSLDFVTIWTLVLLALGTATVAGIKRNSSYIAIFSWWAIFILIRVGWVAAFS